MSRDNPPVHNRVRSTLKGGRQAVTIGFVVILLWSLCWGDGASAQESSTAASAQDTSQSSDTAAGGGQTAPDQTPAAAGTTGTQEQTPASGTPAQQGTGQTESAAPGTGTESTGQAGGTPADQTPSTATGASTGTTGQTADQTPAAAGTTGTQEQTPASGTAAQQGTGQTESAASGTSTGSTGQEAAPASGAAAPAQTAPPASASTGTAGQAAGQTPAVPAAAGTTGTQEQTPASGTAAQQGTGQTKSTATGASTGTTEQAGGGGQKKEEKTQEQKESEAASGALKNQEKPPKRESALETLGVNLISNKLTVEVTESYIHSTTNQLFVEGFGVIPILVVGNVTVENVRKDTLLTSLALRYAVTRDLNASATLPFEYVMTRLSQPTGIAGNQIISPSQDSLGYVSGLGDVSLGANYQLFAESLYRPSLLIGLNFKGRNGKDVFETKDPSLHPPIGSGFYSVGMSLTASKTSAPAIVFGSIGYNHAFPRNNVVFNQKVKPAVLVDFMPGDNLNLSLGMAISLNYQFVLNFSYSQSANFTSEINGIKLGNSATDAISLRIGGTWRFSSKTSVDVGVSFGVTPDAPDFRLDIRVPWRFGSSEH